MNKLPEEVLVHIFKHLHPFQKRQCSLVCRRWQAAMASGCLWETVIVTGIDPLKNIQGHYTKQLFVETQNTCQLNTLPLLFPHLRLLYFFQQDGSNTEYEYLDEENFRTWQTHLEGLIGYSILHHILDMGIYHRLTDITLEDDGRFMETPYTNEFIFKCFLNTPALSTLQLEAFEIDGDDFEYLHKYTPSLTSLTLRRCYMEDEPTPGVVLPALGMKRLQIDDMRLVLFIHSKYVAYIIQKYVNLQYFSFNIQDGERLIPDGSLCKCIQPLIQRLGDQVTTFGMLGHPISPQVFELLDEGHYQLQDARFSTDNITCFVNSLLVSNQIHHLVSLTLQCHISTFEISFESLVHLKSLRLEYSDSINITANTAGNSQMKLNHFISKVCPNTLKHLELSNITLTVDPNLTLYKTLPLHTLKLESVDIEHDISECLSNSCPQLKEICVSKSKEITLDLPHLDISLFEVSSSRRVYLTAEINQEVYAFDGRCATAFIRQYIQKWYGHQDVSVYPHFKLGLLTTTEQRTRIHLTCRSLSTLYIDGCIVLQNN